MKKCFLYIGVIALVSIGLRFAGVPMKPILFGGSILAIALGFAAMGVAVIIDAIKRKKKFGYVRNIRGLILLAGFTFLISAAVGSIFYNMFF